MPKFGMLFDITRCAGCQTCVVTCQLHNNIRPGIAWTKVDALEWGNGPEADRAYLPHGCMICESPACVEVCPTGASTVREDGLVEIDYGKCIGCGLCVGACAFGARTLNAEDKWYFGATEPAPYEAVAPRCGVAEKCTTCAARVDEGEAPWCASACPTGARVFGDLDDPDSDICKYIEESGAINVPGTAIYYVQGPREIPLADTIVSLAQTAGKDGE